VDYGFDAFLPQQEGQFSRIAGIDLAQNAVGNSLFEATGQIIDDEYRMPALFEEIPRMGADISGAACYENSGHVLPSLANAPTMRRLVELFWKIGGVRAVRIT
jgi:hypothetical protein